MHTPSSAPATLPILLALSAAILAPACGRPEPVLTGIPAQPLLSGDNTSSTERSDINSDGIATANSYHRRDGVDIDVHHLGGASFSQNRDLLTEQLGNLKSVRELPGEGGQELTFDRAVVMVSDDQIYMLRVPLTKPLRRSQALERLGFPPYVGRYVTLHREYRLNNTWGFRRIRMMRSSPTDEMIVEVEAWQHVPGQAGPGR
ncbi:MAG: hypothetical protein GXP62_02880 [Oligoflexia bacterium]|nr:hypothetical protein [Oligoflexia bacterium]